MKREELEKAIENGESVWYIVNNELAEIDLSCNFHKIEDSELLTWYDKYSKDYYTHRKKLEDLYKSQAEAEHYLHHAKYKRKLKMKITKISMSISNICDSCKYKDTKKCVYDKLKPLEVCGKYKKKKEYEK